MRTLFLLTLLAGLLSPAFAQSRKPAKAGASALAAGKKVYTENCATCHQTEGDGVPSLNPPLYGRDWVTGEKTRLIRLVLKGMQGEKINGESYHNVMPAHAFLSDKQVADVLTYIRASFGNKASAVGVGEVKAVRGR